MYIERLLALLTDLYHTYPLYTIAVLVIVLLLFFFKTKAMAKFSLLLIALVGIIYVAGLFMDGVSKSAAKKQTMAEKSKQYDN